MTDDAQNPHDAGQATGFDESVAGAIGESLLQKQIDELKAELAEKQDRILRLNAEIDNVRKRGIREVEDVRKYAAAPLIKEVLPVLDNAGRALEAAEKTTFFDERQVAQIVQDAVSSGQPVAPEAFVAGYKAQANNSLLDGFRMLANQLAEALQHVGATKIEALHQPLDTNVHEAITQMPSPHPAMTVVHVAQNGWKLHDRVVRPAQVVVSSGPPAG